MKPIALGILIGLFSQATTAHQTNCHPDNSFCSLKALKTDHNLNKEFNFSKDPAGLGAEAKNNLKKAEDALQNYANIHHCNIYMLSMYNLVQGLMKGSTLIDTDKESNNSDMQGMDKKIILLEGDKAECIKKLGLNLPIKIISPLPHKRHK